MSTTETLCTQLDNLQLEIQWLDVKNNKLKDRQQSNEAEMQLEQLTKEVEKLYQSLNEAQEKEVSCN